MSESAPSPAKSARRPRKPNHAGLNRFLLQALLRLYPPTSLVVGVPPDDCLRLLAESTRPTTRKLHLRDLFADGRRYYIQRTDRGFRMTSDNSAGWGGRRNRSRVTSYLIGTISALETDVNVSLIRLWARMYRFAFIRALFLPTFFASIVLFVGWTPAIKAVIIGLAYALSVVGHRLTAAAQVNEMVFFVHKVFADLPAVVPRELPARNADVAYGSGDFAAEWARFYREQSEDKT